MRQLVDRRGVGGSGSARTRALLQVSGDGVVTLHPAESQTRRLTRLGASQGQLAQPALRQSPNSRSNRPIQLQVHVTGMEGGESHVVAMGKMVVATSILESRAPGLLDVGNIAEQYSGRESALL
jgi:hypothetical protein